MKSLNRPNQRFKWWIKVSFHRWSLFFIRSWWTKCETSMRVYKWGSPACEISQSSAFMFRAEQHLSVQSQLSSLNRLCHREMSRVFCHLLLFTTKDSSVHLVIEEDLLHRLKKKKKLERQSELIWSSLSVKKSWQLWLTYCTITGKVTPPFPAQNL